MHNTSIDFGGSGLQVVSPAPADVGGSAVNAGFKALATRIAAADPDAGDDAAEGFRIGSRWYNSTTTVEWICLDPAPGSARWARITGAPAGYLPASGGPVSGAPAVQGGATVSSLTVRGPANNGCGSVVLGCPGVFHSTLGVWETYGHGSICLTNQCDVYPGDASYSVILDRAGNFGVGVVPLVKLDVGGTTQLNGHDLNMNGGMGTGGGTLSMDGGNLLLGCKSSPPVSPEAGLIYFNTTANHFYGYTGSAWVRLDNS